jgi:hypothetical protein
MVLCGTTAQLQGTGMRCAQEQFFPSGSSLLVKCTAWAMLCNVLLRQEPEPLLL